MTYTQPLILLFSGVALIGLLRIRHCKGILLPTLAVLGFLLLTWPPVAWLASRPLEAPYPVRPPDPRAVQAIVVLGSSVDDPRFERPYPLPNEDSFRRCEFAAWLFRQGKAVPVLASGLGVSIAMADLLRRGGVPETMIWTEGRSRNTHENAVFSTYILREHGISTIALVVDAQSMPRAAACFRKQGIAVIPTPSSFVQIGLESDDLLPGWRAIRDNENTLHEGVGLLWYWLRGWI